MFVSVALPVYNGGTYLSESIASILAQDTDLELIVSDDMSCDGSRELIEGLSDPRIRILKNEMNLGIFGNLNRCIAASRGEFIQVFSQDDLMKPGYLASQAGSLLSNRGAGLVYGTPEYIDEKGSLISSNSCDDTPEIIDHDLYLWISSHYGALPASISSIMIRRRTFEVVGLFNPDYRVAGDIEFYNRVSERFPILRNMETLHQVRSHCRMTSGLSSAGPLYLREERTLQQWYRSRWNAGDYRKIRRFRSASRGRYHLGWIRRTALRGKLREAVRSLWSLNAVYPLHWVIWWNLVGLLTRRWEPRPSVPAPQRQ